MKNASIIPDNMKPLIILAFLLFAGFIPGVFAQESVKPERTGGNTGKVRDMLFPTFKKDIADLNSKPTPPADRSVVSQPTKARLFTNYQPQRSNSNPAPKLRASKGKPLPSDNAAVPVPNAPKAATPIPSQDGGTSSKKN